MKSPALLVFLVAFGLAQYGRAEPASQPVPLGAPAFRPTKEHPLGWRGDGTGCFTGATPSTEWSTNKNVRWSTVVGRGYSSPVATDTSVFVISEPGSITSLKRENGQVRWSFTVTPSILGDANSRQIATDYQLPRDGSGMAAATPVTDGESLYAVFANGIVCALDNTGRLKWASCITAGQSTAYGRSASPLLVGGKLIVHMTHLYALDPATGRVQWVNESAKSSYGTPAALRVEQTDLLVTPNGDVVRLSDGTTVNSDLGHCSHASPLTRSNVIFFADTDISAVRLNQAFQEKSLWSRTVSGDVFGSPLWHDQTLFVSTGDGELFTFRAQGDGVTEPAEHGAKLFEMPATAGPAAYASLTLAGKYLFLNFNRGEVVVLEATPAATVVRRNYLPEGTGSSLAFFGNDLFLRAGDKLWCIGK